MKTIKDLLDNLEYQQNTFNSNLEKLHTKYKLASKIEDKTKIETEIGKIYLNLRTINKDIDYLKNELKKGE